VAYVGHSGGSDEDDEGYLDADFTWRVRPGLTIFSRDNRWSLRNGTDVFNIGAEVELPKDSRFSLSYHYISDLSSSIIASFTGMLSDRYGLRVLEKFELNSRGAGERQNLQTEVTIRRFFHEWIFDVGVRYSKANNDFAVLIGFSPVGLDFWQW